MSWNPLDWPSDLLKWFSQTVWGMIKSMLDFFEKHLLMQSVRPPQGQWADWLYGNALGLVPTLAILLAIISLLLAYFSRRFALKAAHSILLGMVAVPLFLVFFQVCDALGKLGDDLTSAIYQANSLAGGATMFALPDIQTLTWAGLAGFGIFVFGGILEIFLVLLALSVAPVMFMTLPALALSVFFKGARVVFEWCVSLLIVALVLARPVTMICLVTGNIIASQTKLLPIAVIVLIASFILAIWLLFLTIQKTHRITGRIVNNATSHVRGRVETFTKPANRTNVEQVQNIHMRGMRSTRTPRTQAMSLAVRQQYTSHKISNVTQRIAATSNPQVAAALRLRKQYLANRMPRSRR